MTDFIISEREYSAISQELKQLKDERKSLNFKLRNDPDHQKTFASFQDYAQWLVAAEARLAEINERVEYLRTLAHVYITRAQKFNKEKGVYSEREARNRSFLSSSGITKLLIDARLAIEELSELRGDEWRHSDRDVCGSLHALERRIRGDKELNGWFSPSEAQQMRARHESAIAESAAAYRKDITKAQRTIVELQQEIKRERENKGRASRALQRLWDAQYPELEEWRLRRGYTHRIHLNEDMRSEIDAAISGVDV